MVKVPKACIEHLFWAFKNKLSHKYPNMETISHVSVKEAIQSDFQRLFKCKGIHEAYCNDQGLEFPSTCSSPPCNLCGGKITHVLRDEINMPFKSFYIFFSKSIK